MEWGRFQVCLGIPLLDDRFQVWLGIMGSLFVNQIISLKRSKTKPLINRPVLGWAGGSNTLLKWMGNAGCEKQLTSTQPNPRARGVDLNFELPYKV